MASAFLFNYIFIQESVHKKKVEAGNVFSCFLNLSALALNLLKIKKAENV